MHVQELVVVAEQMVVVAGMVRRIQRTANTAVHRLGDGGGHLWRPLA